MLPSRPVRPGQGVGPTRLLAFAHLAHGHSRDRQSDTRPLLRAVCLPWVEYSVDGHAGVFEVQTRGAIVGALQRGLDVRGKRG